MQNNTQSSLAEEGDKRYGMYKNFRTGIVKYYSKGENGKPDNALIEVIESCIGSEGQYYATYNLYVEVDKRFTGVLTMHSVGKWILFGFYIQSFRGANGFDTSLKLRHYEELESNSTTRIGVFDPRITEEDKTRWITVPSNAHELMQEISAKTKFNEYGKRK